MRARYFAALLFDAEGHAEQAESALHETLELARSLGSPVFVASVQSSLAIPLVKQGRAREAEALLAESVPVLERAGKEPLLARSLMTLSVAVLWRSQRAEASTAATHASRALAIFERAGSPYGAAVAADCLGMALFALGRLDEARAHFEGAARVSVPTVESDAKFHLAWLSLKQGRPDEAARWGRELVAIAHSHGLGSAERGAVLVAASMAIGARETRGAAARWLRIVLGDPDLDFEPRLYCAELLSTLSEPTTPLADQAPRDLLSEIGAVLRMGS